MAETGQSQELISTKDSCDTSLRPPLVHQTGPSGLDTLKTYIESLRQNDPEQAIIYEASRLSPYMNALGHRLRQAHTENKPEPPLWARAVINYSDLGGWNPEARSAYEGTNIQQLFNKLAMDTGNILLSEVAIVPTDTLKSLWESQQSPESSIRFFSKEKDIAGYEYHMGFAQCPHKQTNYSVAFPIIALDHRVMEKIPEEQASALLASLKHIATLANHDVMHHLTSTQINGNIRGEYADPLYARPLEIFFNSYLVQDDSRTDSYEAWALLSHAQTYRHMDEGHGAGTLEEQLDHYYTAIENIDAGLKASGMITSHHQRIANYLATAGAHIAMRLIPLTDPLMDRMLGRMEKMGAGTPTLTDHMRDKWKASLTRYPALVDLPALQDLYLELLPMPDFLTRRMVRDVSTTLTQNVRLEIEKPQEYRNPDLKGIANINESNLIHYAALLGQIDFDESLLDDPALSESRRIFLGNEMRSTRQHTVNNIFMAVQSYLQRHINDPETPARLERLGLLYFDGLRRMADKADDQVAGESLGFQALRNYKLSGHDLLGPEGTLPSWRQIKIWDMVQGAPLLAYLGSPDSHDHNLARRRRVSETIDRAVINIVSKPA